MPESSPRRTYTNACETAQALLFDDSFYPFPRPRRALSIRVIGAIDAFTPENGGTVSLRPERACAPGAKDGATRSQGGPTVRIRLPPALSLRRTRPVG